ncbi:MAG: hypothetical protein ABI134_35240 [Byssovorax sp.]
MKACIICGCTDDNACAIGEDGACSWFDHETPVCSRCAENADALIERIAAAPCTAQQLLGPLAGEAYEEAARSLAYALELGALEFDGQVLRVTGPADPPTLQLVGEIGGCEVWSPGTFTAGKGWGPIRSDLAAAVTSAAEPSLVVPFWPAPKEPS